MAKNISRHYKIEKVLLLLFFLLPFLLFFLKPHSTKDQSHVPMVLYVWFLMSDEPSALCLSERLPLGPSEKRLRRELGASLPAGARQQKTSRGE